jgi:ABC-type antimicrobial peptide transport system ATPase subunit
MTNDSIEHSRNRHEFADLSVIVTTVTLVVSLVIAATAVSIGIARADTLVPIAENGGGRFALAVLLALVIAGMGGLTAIMAHDGRAPPRQD